tara:strand:+ start:1164 stop:1775 length:612 start_codon:yes stop_codon:yes gene_type:complete
MDLKEQTEPYQLKVKAKHKRNRLTTKGKRKKEYPFTVNPPKERSKSAPPPLEEEEFPHWHTESEEKYEPTVSDLHRDLRVYSEAEEPRIEPEAQYEVNVRLKIAKAKTTKGEVLAQVRGIPGVTIVDPHGDPRAKFFKKPEDPDYIFSTITIRFYSIWPFVGDMTKENYVKRFLFPGISAIGGVGKGIGQHGGVKPLSRIRSI